MLKTAIFDFDMTLVDSFKAIVIGLNKIAARFRLPEVSPAEVKPLLHADTRRMWTGLWGHYDEAWKTYFWESVSTRERDYLEPAPGAAELLQRLKGRGIGLGLATNRERPWKALTSVGLAPYFDTAVGALEVARVKPAPDMLLAALERLGAAPEGSVYVGDSVSDMAAAAAAGLRGVGVMDGSGLSREELLAAGAWQVRPTLNDLADLLG